MEIRINKRSYYLSPDSLTLLSHLGCYSSFRIEITKESIDLRLIGETDTIDVVTFDLMQGLISVLKNDLFGRKIHYEIHERKIKGERIPDAIVIRFKNPLVST